MRRSTKARTALTSLTSRLRQKSRLLRLQLRLRHRLTQPEVASVGGCPVSCVCVCSSLVRDGAVISTLCTSMSTCERVPIVLKGKHSFTERLPSPSTKYSDSTALYIRSSVLLASNPIALPLRTRTASFHCIASMRRVTSPVIDGLSAKNCSIFSGSSSSS